jgi:hypothetical protein
VLLRQVDEINKKYEESILKFENFDSEMQKLQLKYDESMNYNIELK